MAPVLKKHPQGLAACLGVAAPGRVDPPGALPPDPRDISAKKKDLGSGHGRHSAARWETPL